MELLSVTYEIKLISSKGVRGSLNDCLPKFCSEHNCECTIEVKTKWYWFHDVYTIKITGDHSDINYIEKQLKYLTTI